MQRLTIQHLNALSAERRIAEYYLLRQQHPNDRPILCDMLPGGIEILAAEIERVATERKTPLVGERPHPRETKKTTEWLQKNAKVVQQYRNVLPFSFVPIRYGMSALCVGTQPPKDLLEQTQKFVFTKGQRNREAKILLMFLASAQINNQKIAIEQIRSQRDPQYYRQENYYTQRDDIFQASQAFATLSSRNVLSIDVAPGFANTPEAERSFQTFLQDRSYGADPVVQFFPPLHDLAAKHFAAKLTGPLRATPEAKVAYDALLEVGFNAPPEVFQKTFLAFLHANGIPENPFAEDLVHRGAPIESFLIDGTGIRSVLSPDFHANHEIYPDAPKALDVQTDVRSPETLRYDAWKQLDPEHRMTYVLAALFGNDVFDRNDRRVGPILTLIGSEPLPTFFAPTMPRAAELFPRTTNRFQGEVIEPLGDLGFIGATDRNERVVVLYGDRLSVVNNEGREEISPLSLSSFAPNLSETGLLTRVLREAGHVDLRVENGIVQIAHDPIDFDLIRENYIEEMKIKREEREEAQLRDQKEQERAIVYDAAATLRSLGFTKPLSMGASDLHEIDDRQPEVLESDISGEPDPTIPCDLAAHQERPLTLSFRGAMPTHDVTGYMIGERFGEAVILIGSKGDYQTLCVPIQREEQSGEFRSMPEVGTPVRVEAATHAIQPIIDVEPLHRVSLEPETPSQKQGRKTIETLMEMHRPLVLGDQNSIDSSMYGTKNDGTFVLGPTKDGIIAIDTANGIAYMLDKSDRSFAHLHPPQGIVEARGAIEITENGKAFFRVEREHGLSNDGITNAFVQHLTRGMRPFDPSLVEQGSELVIMPIGKIAYPSGVEDIVGVVQGVKHPVVNGKTLTMPTTYDMKNPLGTVVLSPRGARAKDPQDLRVFRNLGLTMPFLPTTGATGVRNDKTEISDQERAEAMLDTLQKSAAEFPMLSRADRFKLLSEVGSQEGLDALAAGLPVTAVVDPFTGEPRLGHLPKTSEFIYNQNGKDLPVNRVSIHDLESLVPVRSGRGISLEGTIVGHENGETYLLREMGRREYRLYTCAHPDLDGIPTGQTVDMDLGRDPITDALTIDLHLDEATLERAAEQIVSASDRDLTPAEQE